MTYERELQIRKMWHSKGVWGMTIQEVKELENKYGIRCEKYSCGGCIMRFLGAIENKLPLNEYMNGEEKH